jgi:hypothetical protein
MPCCPRVLRTMSRPLDSGAYRNVCSAAPSDLMVATKDFSGLTSSPCALASAAASCAIDSLDRCMGITFAVIKQGKTDGARFRALRPDRLWREKRGEVEPEDLSSNLIVQLEVVTEDLNRCWYEANTGQVITDIQRQVRHPALHWMAATLDGRVRGSEAVFEAKFMLPWSFSEEAAAGKYMPQLQHNMWVVAARSARCVESGEPPTLFGVDPPKPRIEAVRIVDMTSSNAWAEFAAAFSRTATMRLDRRP